MVSKRRARKSQPKNAGTSSIPLGVKFEGEEEPIRYLVAANSAYYRWSGTEFKNSRTEAFGALPDIADAEILEVKTMGNTPKTHKAAFIDASYLPLLGHWLNLSEVEPV